MKRAVVVLLFLLTCAETSCARSQPKSLATTTTTTTTSKTLSYKKNAAFVKAAWQPPMNDIRTSRVRGGAESTRLASFVTRASSAIVVLALLCVWLQKTGKNGLVGLILVAQIGMFTEVAKVTGMKSLGWSTLLNHFIFWNGHYLLKLNNQGDLVNLVSFGILMLNVMLLVFTQNRGQNALIDFCKGNVLASVVIGMSSSWLATLERYNMVWIFYPGLLVIVNDTMAYICGQLFGRNALLPKISPKKTWEGFIGAMIFTIALSKPIWTKLGEGTHLGDNQLYILALYVSLVTPFGGFLASTVKRTFGYKDFGSIMPGHGGLVDRLDCQLFTAPFVYFFLRHNGKIPSAI